MSGVLIPEGLKLTLIRQISSKGVIQGYPFSGWIVGMTWKKD